MKQSFTSKALRSMSPEQQDDAMRRLVQVARGKPNGEIRDLDQQIHSLEVKHGLSSAQLRSELAQGKREETWEICQWLMLLDQRDLLGSSQTRSR